MDSLPYDPNHPLVRHLWSVGADSPPKQRIAAAVAAYNEATGQSLELPLDATDAKEVADWLKNEECNTPKNSQGHGVALLYGLRRASAPLVHPDLASKISWLSQAPCPTCLYDMTAKPLSANFGVYVRPFSAQSIKGAGKLGRIKDAIRSDLQRRGTGWFDPNTFEHGNFCVNVVAVLPKAAKIMDPDNMIKGLLDSMQGAIYENDRQVQHVASHRVIHGGTISYYSVDVTPVTDISADVVDDVLRIKLLGGTEIDLDTI